MMELKAKKSKKSLLAALCSSVFWGSGQALISKQYVKGILFFIFQVGVIATELVTGYWIEYFSGLIPDFSIRVYGGFFTKSIWGLITLGEVPREDHSIMLMMTGIIVSIILLFILFFYIYNVVDAYKTQKEYEKTGERISTKKYFKDLYRRSFAKIILFPIAVLFLFVVAMPIISTVLIAFTDYSRNVLPPANLVSWVGFDNFFKLIDVPVWADTFFNILVWTIFWTFLVSLGAYFLGLFQALMLNSVSKKSRRIYQTIMILPWAIPSMVTLLYFRTIFNGRFGAVNQFLLDIGLIEEQIAFFSDPAIARILVVCVAIFIGFPSFMLMFLGVLSNLDTSVYEAADLDGASKFQVFRHITFPLIFNATGPLLIMNLAFNFNAFGTIYFLTEGGPVNPNYQFAGDTDILISWIYELTLNQQMYGMAAVMSLLIFIFIGAVSYWNFRRTTSFKEI